MSGGAKRILLGAIASAHGIRGELLVKTFTAEPQAIADYGPLTDTAGTRSFTLKVVRATPKGVIVRIAGVADRTAAEKLRGTELYVARDALPKAEDGAYYHADLVGLEAVDPDGKAVGKVVAVQNFGAGDLLEIALAGSRTTELVPFQDAFVPSVDVAGGRLTLIMPVAVGDPEPSEDGRPADEPEGETGEEDAERG